MTNEEAINILTKKLNKYLPCSEIFLATQMAIDVLTQDIQVEEMERAIEEEQSNTRVWREKACTLTNQLNNAIHDLECLGRFDGEHCAYCIHDNECEPGEMLCSYNGDGAFEWRGRANL